MSKIKEWIIDTGVPEFIGARARMLQADGYCIEYLHKINENKMMSFAYRYRNEKEVGNEQSVRTNTGSAEINPDFN